VGYNTAGNSVTIYTSTRVRLTHRHVSVIRLA